MRHAHPVYFAVLSVILALFLQTNLLADSLGGFYETGTASITVAPTGIVQVNTDGSNTDWENGHAPTCRQFDNYCYGTDRIVLNLPSFLKDVAIKSATLTESWTISATSVATQIDAQTKFNMWGNPIQSQDFPVRGFVDAVRFGNGTIDGLSNWSFSNPVSIDLTPYANNIAQSHYIQPEIGIQYQLGRVFLTSHFQDLNTFGGQAEREFGLLDTVFVDSSAKATLTGTATLSITYDQPSQSNMNADAVSKDPTPEPASLFLSGLGAALVAIRFYRKSK